MTVVGFISEMVPDVRLFSFKEDLRFREVAPWWNCSGEYLRLPKLKNLTVSGSEIGKAMARIQAGGTRGGAKSPPLICFG